MARTRKNTVSPASITLDWTAIEADLNAGRRVSLSHLAQAHKVFPIDLRRLFEGRYGTRVEFRRGRSGGVYWRVAPAPTAAAPADAPNVVLNANAGSLQTA